VNKPIDVEMYINGFQLPLHYCMIGLVVQLIVNNFI